MDHSKNGLLFVLMSMVVVVAVAVIMVMVMVMVMSMVVVTMIVVVTMVVMVMMFMSMPMTLGYRPSVIEPEFWNCVPDDSTEVAHPSQSFSDVILSVGR